MAKLDELVCLPFREQRLGFVAEVFDGLEGDRGDKETAENRASELLDLLAGLTLPVDFRFERWSGEIDARDASVVALGCPTAAPCYIEPAARYSPRNG